MSEAQNLVSLIRKFAHIIPYHETLVFKEVILFEKGTVITGILDHVEQVAYGIKPVYHILVGNEGVIVKSTGLICPFDSDIFVQAITGNYSPFVDFTFEPFKLSDFL